VQLETASFPLPCTNHREIGIIEDITGILMQ